MQWCHETGVSSVGDSGCCVLVSVFHPTGTGVPAKVPQRVLAVVVRGLLGDAERHRSDISDVVFVSPSCVMGRVAALECFLQNACNARGVADCGGVRALNLAVRRCSNDPALAAQGCVALTRLAQSDAPRSSFVKVACVETVLIVLGQHATDPVVQARALALLSTLVESRRMQLDFRKLCGAAVLQASLTETLRNTVVVRGILDACSR